MGRIANVRLIFGIIILVTVISIEAAWAYRPIAWSTERQVTHAPGDSNLVDIAADNSGGLHLVWEDNRDGSVQVYYKSSRDNGLTWGPDIRLSNLSAHTIEPLPRLVLAGNQILAVFSEGTGNGEHLLYVASQDAGSTFSAQRQLTSDAGYQTNTALAEDRGALHLVWQNYLDGSEHIYYMRSADMGITWSNEFELTSGAAQDRHPAIAALGKNISVVWARVDQSENAVFSRSSHDGGNTWLPEVQLSEYQPGAFPIFPSIATNGTRVDAVWNGFQVLYAQSSNGGSRWGSLQPLTNSSRQFLAPRISSSGQHLQVVVAAISIEGNDVRSISSNIYYVESPDGGDSWTQPTSLTTHAARLQSLAPVIATRPDSTFVAWEDNRNGAYAIFTRSKPDFVALKSFWNSLATYSLAFITPLTVCYLYLEIRNRNRKRSKTRTRRRPRMGLRTPPRRRTSR